MSISLDGYVAGPNQSLEGPIGEGGMRLHEWIFATDGWRRQHGQEGGDLAAGLLDELYLHIVPIVLGAGERLLENVGDPKLEPAEVVGSPAVTHIRYRIVHG